MFYGWKYQPFQFGDLNDATRGYLNNAGDSGDPLRHALSAYTGQLQQSGGPQNFINWLMGNRSFLTNLYESQNASKLASGGGLDSQLMPIDWLSGQDGSFNLWETFMGRTPRERGEGQQQPFVRFLTR